MKDWEERLNELESKLQTWNDTYDREFHRLRKERGLNSWFKQPAKSELEAAAQDARQIAGDDAPRETFLFLDDLGEHFMNSLPQVRGLIRARVGASNAVFGFLWAYIVQTAELLKSEADGPRLRAGLAGVCIDDARGEFNQLHEVLGSIYVAATRAGIDPRPYFADAATVANPGASGGGTFLRGILADFEQSEHFRDHIKPHPSAEWFRPASA